MEVIVIHDFFGGPHDDILMRMTVEEASAHGATVSFYDRRYMHSDHGQKISSYYIQDLLQHPTDGLNLAGDVPDWTLNAVCFKRLCGFLDGLNQLATSEVAA